MMLDFDGPDTSKGTNYVPEFQAVILCGGGSILGSLTQTSPKALLPVANKPMLHYPTTWLERAGITDVILVAPTEHKENIVNYISNYEGSLKFDLHTQRSLDNTASALRQIKDKIKRDFIVISCDLITDIEPRIILDAHRVTDPSMTALFYEPVKSESSLKAEKPHQYWVGVDSEQSRLVYLERIDKKQELLLRKSLVRKFPHINLLSNLHDAHLYVFKRWILDVIVQRTNITSIKDDLLPLLIRSQSQKNLFKKEELDKLSGRQESFFNAAERLSTSCSSGSSAVKDPIFCRVQIVRPNGSQTLPGMYTETNAHCGRVNHISGYLDMNRVLTKSEPTRVAASAKVSKVKTQIGTDSLVGEMTILGSRSSVKRATVGDHVEIGDDVKIDKSVIMDHVKLGKNINLSGCIIGHHSTIEDGCILKECIVAPYQTVRRDTHGKDEEYKGPSLSANDD